MANIKSAKKRAITNVARRSKNLHRKSDIKTAVRKVLDAIENNLDAAKTQELFREVEAKIARAKGKHTLHAKTASRKISRLARRVNQAVAA